MRRLLLVLAAVVVALGQPVASLPQGTSSFGIVPPGTEVAAAFTLRNLGDTPLVILEVIPECGCTRLTALPEAVPPGAALELRFKLSVGSLEGALRKAVRIRTNDPKRPDLTLEIQGEVRSLVKVQPATRIAVELQRTGTVDHVLAVEGLVPVALGLEGLQELPFLDWHVLQQDPLHAELVLTFSGPRIPVGQRSGSRALLLRTGIQEQPSLEVALEWRLAPLFKARPETLVVQGGAGATLVLEALDAARPFAITGIQCDHQVLEVEGDLHQARPSHVFHIGRARSAPDSTGRRLERVRFSTDQPDQPELPVRVLVLETGPKP